MPYSRAKEKRLAKLIPWPDIRYSPTGECKMFYEAKDVPIGWTQKRPLNIDAPVGTTLDREELLTELSKMGIEVRPEWANAHLKRIIDDRNSAR